MKGIAGASVFMWIIPDHSSKPKGRQVPIDTRGPVELPKCRFVNLEALPGSKLGQQAGEGFKAMLLLENPVGENLLTFDQLEIEVKWKMCYSNGKGGKFGASKVQGVNRISTLGVWLRYSEGSCASMSVLIMALLGGRGAIFKKVNCPPMLPLEKKSMHFGIIMVLNAIIYFVKSTLDFVEV